LSQTARLPPRPSQKVTLLPFPLHRLLPLPLGKSIGSPPPPPSEGCGKSNGEVKEVWLNAAALTNPNSLHTPNSLPSHSSVSSSGLVDSGSSHCFVDPSFVSLHSIPSYEISSVILRLLDGSVGANITHTADISIQFSTNDILPLKFYTLSWLLPLRSFDPPPAFRNPLFLNSLLPPVSFINAAAYARLARVKGNTIFMISISNSDSATGFAANTDPVDVSGIPEEYHKFGDVFSKSQASTLPLHRPNDLKIDLNKGAKPPIERMYSLSKTEMTVLRQFLDKNLHNGFVCSSNSLHGAPILFVKKKDGSLRLCVDFWGLNKISKKDHYPLPLISDLLDSPGKARIYTKIDLQHTYRR